MTRHATYTYPYNYDQEDSMFVGTHYPIDFRIHYPLENHLFPDLRHPHLHQE